MNQNSVSVGKKILTFIISLVLGFILAPIFNIAVGFISGLYAPLNFLDRYPFSSYAYLIYIILFTTVIYRSIISTKTSSTMSPSTSNQTGLKLILGVVIIIISVVATVFTLVYFNIGYK